MNTILFCSYNIIFSLFEQFELTIKHGKLEVFHFSRSTKNFNLSSLNLSLSGGPILWPKNTWRYLDFIFNKKLSFHHHVHFYSNKVIFTTKSMKMLGNSTRSLSTVHKWLLYRMCIIPIVFYKLLLWYFKSALLFYPLKDLRKIQQSTCQDCWQ